MIIIKEQNNYSIQLADFFTSFSSNAQVNDNNYNVVKNRSKYH